MTKLQKQTSQALAAKVVSFRVLKLNRDAAVEAMEELSRRAAAGDTFDYETYIKTKMEEIPSPTAGAEHMEVLKRTLRNIKNGTV